METTQPPVTQGSFTESKITVPFTLVEVSDAAIATIGTIADGTARASGRTIDAVMRRAGSTGLSVQLAFVFGWRLPVGTAL